MNYGLHFPIPIISVLAFFTILFILLIYQYYKNRRSTATSLLLKVLSLTLLILAISDPYIEQKIENSEVAVLLDISRSILPQYKESLTKVYDIPVTKTFRFAAEVEGDSAMIGSYVLNHARTNIEEALNRASAYPNIILATDGFQTSGDYRNAISNLRNSGSKVYPIVGDQKLNSKLYAEIEDLFVPLKIDGEKTIVAQSIIQVYQELADAEIISYFDGQIIDQKSLGTLKPGQLRNETDVYVSGGGSHTISVELKSGNTVISEKKAYINVSAKIKALLMASSNSETWLLKEVFRKQQVDYDLATGKDIKEQRDFKKYKFIVLCNVSRNLLSSDGPANIQKYVQAGGALLVTGGNQSYGLGNYKDTELAETLPVAVVDPRKVEKRLNTAVELVLDKSGSMKEYQKLDYVKLAAKELIKNLKNDDYIGIIGFDEAPFVALKPELLAVSRERALERVDLLYPGRSTRLLPALDIAQKQLGSIRAGRKHLIILTDGELPDANSMKSYYLDIASDLASSGTTISTFLIGSDHSQVLEDMADKGGGKFYSTTDSSSIPRLFIEDLKVTVADQTQHENAEFPVEKGQLRSTRVGDLEPVLGYVQTEQKKSAVLELYTSDSSGKSPILASWKYGKGQSIAFTSDLSGRWTQNSLNNSKLETLTSDLIDTLRGDIKEENQRSDYDLSYSTNKGVLDLKLTLWSKELQEQLNPVLRTPRNTLIPINFTNTAKGYLEASLALPQSGKYTFEATFAAGSLFPVSFEINLEQEEQAKGVNMPVLQEIADRTGGKIIKDKSEFNFATIETKNEFGLAPILFALALLFYLFEIIFRERWS